MLKKATDHTLMLVLIFTQNRQSTKEENFKIIKNIVTCLTKIFKTKTV